MNAAPAKPQITVVIPAYNVAPYIAEALASVQAQTLSNFDAIVIDDGSTDDTAAKIAPFLADPRFKCITTHNRGLCAARNLGLANAKTRYVALLDGDDRYLPNYLAAMLERIERAPHADFVTCDAESFCTEGGPRETFSDRYPQGEPITLSRFLRQEVAIFGLCTMRLSAVLAVGGYDEALQSAEDLDLWLRMLIAGQMGGLVPRKLVEYRRRMGSLSQDVVAINESRAQVFANAALALEKRPEADLARLAQSQALAVAHFERGVDLVIAGRIREGVSSMRDSGHKQAMIKWRIALAFFSLLPPLARPALTLYRRGNQFA